MWLPYNTNQELTHISMIFTYWIPWIYQQYTWIVIGITLIALLPICLYIYQKYCTKQWWRFIEFTVVYPHPNIYRIFVDLDYRSVLSYYKTIGIIVLAILACHYIPFLLILKSVLIVMLVLAVTVMPLVGGYYSPWMIIGVICICTGGYYYDFSIGLPVFEPHYTIDWVSAWLPFINNGKPIVINPYNFLIDCNKYFYVYCLIFCYMALIKLVLNHFYWLIFRHKPVKEFEYIVDNSMRDLRVFKIKRLRKQLTQQRKKSIKAGTYVPRAKVKLVQDSREPLGSSNSQSIGKDTSNNTERSLKLLGFKQQAIKVMIAEYGVDTLEKELDKLDMLDDLTTPKNNFLKILQDTHDNIL